MTPERLPTRGLAKTRPPVSCISHPATAHTTTSSTTSIPQEFQRPKRLSRELAGLAPWSGWKGERGDSSTESGSEFEDDATSLSHGSVSVVPSAFASADSIGQKAPLAVEQVSASAERGECRKRAEQRRRVKSGATEVELRQRQGEDRASGIVEVVDLNGDDNDTDTITVAHSDTKPRNPIRRSIIRRSGDPPHVVPPFSQVDSTGSFSSNSSDSGTSISDTETSTTTPEPSSKSIGPLCPLCICPLTGVNFPTITCLSCSRTYHTQCICNPDRYNLFEESTVPEADRCHACGCPVGLFEPVYTGYPGLMFHEREWDVGFDEFLRLGRLECARWEGLM